MLDETRRQAQLRMASYQERVAWYYNSQVKPKIFRIGDFVLRRVEVSKPTKQEKLSPNWKGSYKILTILRPGVYKIENLGGMKIFQIRMLRIYECTISKNIL